MWLAYAACSKREQGLVFFDPTNQLKNAHVAAVGISGFLFALRGLALLANAHWPLAVSTRRVSYLVDTALLVAGLLLVWRLPAAVFANGWLLTKLSLLSIYIGLGILALRPLRSRHARALSLLLALTVFAFIVGAAHRHHPWSWFAPS